MKYKTFSLFLLQFLFLYAFSSALNITRKPSPIEFFKQFQGSQKGDKVKGIHQLKEYLQKLGYVNHNSSGDYFDENLESAIKTYQINFNLNPTGTLDLKTESTMAKPRCGVPDLINGTTRMRISSDIFHSHYALFPGNPKWPVTLDFLTYSFAPGTRDDAKEAVKQALLTWSSVTPFAFTFLEDYEVADIKISFQRGEHGDGIPFDGPGGALAHASAPTTGLLHFDADETWAVGAVPGAADIQTAALHELGHVFGLAHSSVEEAIMYPFMPTGSVKRGLDHDDILGLQTLYTS
ncbi:Metalloendoproteinase [Melia azedarach]|uniref:Metalloendoproteinase n=1 Tax=Melia azedarach TaxID=155640 RepID=A0ACC1WV39_MELAZ|nr:Metalloendoproteinase [Melia azedarach]